MSRELVQRAEEELQLSLGTLTNLLPPARERRQSTDATERGTLSIEEVTRLFVTSRGRLERYTKQLVVKAEKPDVTGLRIQIGSAQENTAAPIEFLHGGVLDEAASLDDDPPTYFIRFPFPLRQGELHEVVLTAKAAAPDEPYFRVIPRLHQYRSLSLRFCTEPGAPLTLYRFDRLHPRNLKGGSRTDLSSTGFARADFNRLERGWSYGLRWERRSEH